MKTRNLLRCLLLVLCQRITLSQEEQQAEGFDCFDIWTKNNLSDSGIYTVKPKGADVAFKVFCEMTKEGGWTLIQKHNGEDRLSFNKKWDDYENGFGKLGGEHWLGLRYIHALTRQTDRPSKLHIRIEDFNGHEAFAEYSPFSVGNAQQFYRLSAGIYSGTAGDAFFGNSENGRSNQHTSFFSTIDKPNDKCNPICRVGDLMYISCSHIYQAGWWFNSCGEANLNGRWRQPPRHMNQASAVSWPTWRPNESLKFSKIYLIHN
ncbi:fibrinogen-like protein 1 [Hyla sarda]|uniref:fibrinogen-like protein 1 n=1 Tax=Hyla sarda TaxID=327740 RepID=UPI0024C2E183|nr:fibrinogen-like protein 1 [Hyla sarda]